MASYRRVGGGCDFGDGGRVFRRRRHVLEAGGYPAPILAKARLIEALERLGKGS